MATVTISCKVRVRWWIKCLYPVWLVQRAFGFAPWVPRCAVVVSVRAGGE